MVSSMTGQSHRDHKQRKARMHRFAPAKPWREGETVVDAEELWNSDIIHSEAVLRRPQNASRDNSCRSQQRRRPPSTTVSILLLGPWLSLFVFILLGKDSIVQGADVICPRGGSQDTSTRMQPNDPNGQSFTEISGLALSPFQRAPDSGAPLLYGINDSGGGTRLGIFDSSTGQRLLTLRLEGVQDTDWESLAIGTCGVTFNSMSGDDICVYIGDVGDNWARGSRGTNSRRGGANPKIIKFREPKIEDFDDNDKIPEIAVLEYNYAHASSPTEFADSESIFMDNKGWGDGFEAGDLYVLTKWSKDDISKLTRLFRIPASAWLDTTSDYSPATVGTYNRGGDLLSQSWTGADMTWDGTLVALRSVDGIHLFARCPGVSVADALTGGTDACHDWTNRFNLPDMQQIETIAWTPGGTRTLQISECVDCKPPMAYTEMDYNDPAQIISCPLFEERIDTSSPTTLPSFSPSGTTTTTAPSLGPSGLPTTHQTTPLPTVALTTPSPSEMPVERADDTNPPSAQPSSASIFTLVASQTFLAMIVCWLPLVFDG